ncbi:unnamed protein product [Discula destructiva]
MNPTEIITSANRTNNILEERLGKMGDEIKTLKGQLAHVEQKLKISGMEYNRLETELMATKSTSLQANERLIGELIMERGNTKAVDQENKSLKIQFLATQRHIQGLLHHNQDLFAST